MNNGVGVYIVLREVNVNVGWWEIVSFFRRRNCDMKCFFFMSEGYKVVNNMCGGKAEKMRSVSLYVKKMCYEKVR